MESYIIRIYRRYAEDPQKLVGLVEVAGTEERKRFTNLDELSKILNPHKTVEEKEKKGRRKA